jgi:DNA-binding transcriptional ArsR family regulator
MGGGEGSEAAAEFLKAIAHPGRLSILCQLVECGRTVGEIAAALELPQPIASQQLSRLRHAGVVRTERRGRQVLYSLAAPEIAQLIGLLRLRFCALA